MSTKGYKFYKTEKYRMNVRTSLKKYWKRKKGLLNSDDFSKDHGYVLIYKPNHPFCNKAGYVYEHRLVIEKSLCRYLIAKERVHHINGIRHDNRIENLKLFKNGSEHSSFHFPKNSLIGKNKHLNKKVLCN